jgi:hypothetical protein
MISPRALLHDWQHILVIGGVLLAFGGIADYQSDRAANHLRDDLNTYVRLQCESGQSAAVIGKYNSALRALIQDLKDRERLNRARGDIARAQINATTIGALEASLIAIPKQDCSKPILPH